MSTISERVQRGAGWLDAHEPGWLPRIDVVRLNMSVGTECIWGQLRGAFAWMPREVGDPLPLGFNADYRLAEDEWVEATTALTAEWVRVITERRAAA